MGISRSQTVTKPLIVMDLDGSLLDSDGVLSNRAAEALRRALDLGMDIAVATGRNKNEALLSLAGIEMTIISNNGAATWCPYEDRFVDHHGFDRKMGNALRDSFDQYGHRVSLLAIDSSDRLSYTCDPRSDFELKMCREFSACGIRCQEMLSEGDKLINAKCVKKGPFESKLIEFLDCAQHLDYYHEASIYDPEIWFVEVFASNVSKRDAVEFLKRRGSFGTVFCIGDGMNDLSMRKVADKFLAPANAHAQVLEAADQVIPSNDDYGVAIFLESFIDGNIT